MGAFLRSSVPYTFAAGSSVPQHVGNDEIADVGAANVDLFEMRHATVSGSDSNVLELNVHVVLSCHILAALRI